MRKALISIMVIAAVSVVIYYTSFSSNNKEELLQSQIEQLQEKHGENLFIAYYSIGELRSYSIIQLDKTIEMYNNQWITPEEIVAKLNNDDKARLNDKIIQRLKSFNNGKDQELIQKIQLWCVAKSQFDLISSQMGFDRTELLTVIKDMNFASEVFASINKTGNTKIDNINPQKQNEAFYSVMNKVANLSFNEQLMFHSNLFAGLNKMSIN